MQCVENCHDPDPSRHVEFSQPVWQTLQMFLGECLCLLPVFYSRMMKRWRERRDAGKIALPADNANGDVEAGQDTNEAQEENDVKTEAAAAFSFFLPALCDICGTTLMNVGLLFTPVSIYQ